ncbi:MAG: hypothetical protein ACJAYU_000566 [Bradymonadia bacterium]
MSNEIVVDPPTTTIKALSLLHAALGAFLISGTASRARADETEDAAWDASEAADLAFQESQQDCDAVDAATTGGDRTCRDAIEDGLHLAAAVEDVLAIQSLDDDMRESPIDLLLTSQQIVGKYMVDVGDCEAPEDIHSGVLENPLLGNRRRL